MSALSKVENHAFSSFISILHPVCGHGSRTISSRIQSPETTNVLARHEDDPSFELLWCTHWFSLHLLNLVEKTQCSESWEFFSLELRRLPVDSIQIFEIACLQTPFAFVFPSFGRLITAASETEHRVGKDVGLGIRNMNSSITQQRCISPHGLLPVSRGETGGLYLIFDQPISDSVELWETDVCFLHIQLIGTNVWLPKTHNVPPEVDFESSRSPAKSESWNSPNLHCLAVLPTWQYCLNSHVWWM